MGLDTMNGCRQRYIVFQKGLTSKVNRKSTLSFTCDIVEWVDLRTMSSLDFSRVASFLVTL